MADEIGHPVMLKASWGGGGRGMRVIRERADLAREVAEARREAKAAFGKDEVHLGTLVERARHVESQILGDTHGNAAQLCERDCSIQRRNQKVVERAGTPLSRISIRPRPSSVCATDIEADDLRTVQAAGEAAWRGRAGHGAFRDRRDGAVRVLETRCPPPRLRSRLDSAGR